MYLKVTILVGTKTDLTNSDQFKKYDLKNGAQGIKALKLTRNEN